MRNKNGHLSAKQHHFSHQTWGVKARQLIFLVVWPSCEAVWHVDEMSARPVATWHEIVSWIRCLVFSALGFRNLYSSFSQMRCSHFKGLRTACLKWKLSTNGEMLCWYRRNEKFHRCLGKCASSSITTQYEMDGKPHKYGIKSCWVLRDKQPGVFFIKSGSKFSWFPSFVKEGFPICQM